VVRRPEGFDCALECRAQNLGANGWRTFRFVTFPLIRPGIVSAALLAFVTSFDEVVVAIFVSGTQAATLPKQMWDGIRTEIDPTVAAVSTLLIGVTAAVICISAIVRLRPIHAHEATSTPTTPARPSPAPAACSSSRR
jgi:putative spermidine/putrescine transport system permease protein